MPIFISYSHADKSFVDTLAAHLVKRNAHVWVDSWELNVGDSIIGRVQEAIQDSSALLVILSKASVQSEWCKKELSAGLMRELDEKRVVVLPVLLEDCEIPMFLREKMYADFRKDFDKGVSAIVDAVAKVTNADQGRIHSGKGNMDWAEDWGFHDDLFILNFTIIESSPEWPFTLLTEVTLHCNGVVTEGYRKYVAAGLDWMGRRVITEALADLADAQDIRLLLENQFPEIYEACLVDPRRGTEYNVIIRCRRLGEDNGKDQLVNISNYLRGIRDFMRNISRKPTKEELARLKVLLGEL